MTHQQQHETYEQRLKREHKERRAKFFPDPAPPRVAVPLPIVIDQIPKGRDPLWTIGAFSRQKALRVVADHYNISLIDLLSPGHGKHLVWARAVACYLMRTRWHMTLPMIGRAIRRDHSSVLHLVRMISAQQGGTTEFEELVSDLANKARAKVRQH